ncbi:11172_t:CDS:1, partial [Racocetra persica]
MKISNTPNNDKAQAGDGFLYDFKEKFNVHDSEIVELDKYFRRIWRSSLSLESYPLVLKQHCDSLQKKFYNDNYLKDYQKAYLIYKLTEYQDKFNLANQTGEKRLCND